MSAMMLFEALDLLSCQDDSDADETDGRLYTDAWTYHHGFQSRFPQSSTNIFCVTRSHCQGKTIP